MQLKPNPKLMPEDETLLTPPDQERTEIIGLQEIREVLDECIVKEVPCQIIKRGGGGIQEHFFSDFHRVELYHGLNSLKLSTEYSVVILGTSIKPRYAISFTAEDVSHIILTPHLGKTFVQIIL